MSTSRVALSPSLPFTVLSITNSTPIVPPVIWPRILFAVSVIWGIIFLTIWCGTPSCENACFNTSYLAAASASREISDLSWPISSLIFLVSSILWISTPFLTCMDDAFSSRSARFLSSSESRSSFPEGIPASRSRSWIYSALSRIHSAFFFSSCSPRSLSFSSTCFFLSV